MRSLATFLRGRGGGGVTFGWERPNGITPEGRLKIEPRPALSVKRVVPANSVQGKILPSSLRFHQRKYWYCLCHARRGCPRLSGYALRSRECFARTKTHSVRHTARISSTPIPRKAPMGPSRLRGSMRRRILIFDFYADQYSNDANWRAYYDTTANEIWQQTRRAHHVLRRHALGTTGTLAGAYRGD